MLHGHLSRNFSDPLLRWFSIYAFRDLLMLIISGWFSSKLWSCTLVLCAARKQIDTRTICLNNFRRLWLLFRENSSLFCQTRFRPARKKQGNFPDTLYFKHRLSSTSTRKTMKVSSPSKSIWNSSFMNSHPNLISRHIALFLWCDFWTIFMFLWIFVMFCACRVVFMSFVFFLLNAI